MKEYYGKPALELCSIINTLTGDLFDDGLPMSKELNAVIVSRIHWISHELECRLDGQGGRQFATGPLLIELPTNLTITIEASDDK